MPHVLLLKCHHCIIMCSFFVELPSFLPQLYMRVFWSRTIKHHLSTSIAFVSVRCRRPSTREATPSDGDSLNPATTEKLVPNVGPMAGGRDIIIDSKQQVGHPTADRKVIQKMIYLCKRTPANVRLWQGGR